MILFQVTFYDALAPDLKLFYEVNLEIDPEEVAQICEQTLGQSTNDVWHLRRLHRITASRFHNIMRARQRITRWNRFSESISGTVGY